MPSTFTRHTQGQNDADDNHSTATTSISDSKSSGTTFSAKQSHLAIHCPSETTSPPQSRAQSPVQCPITAMDADLCGVGHMPSTPTNRTFKTTLPYHPQRQQSQSLATNMVAGLSGPDDVFGGSGMSKTSQIENCDESIGYQDDIVLASHDISTQRYSPDLSTVGKMFPDTPTYDVFSIEDVSDNWGELEGANLDLEKSADEALSKWFGISLGRLSRPDRIIYAFEQIKERCSDILQDEGHYQVDEHYSQEDQRSEEDLDTTEEEEQDLAGTPIQPYNTGGETQTNFTPGSLSNSNSTSRINGKKRSQSGTVGSSASSDLFIKTRGPNKKRRVEGEYSCPYRKRNPRRFNVREHENCANKSYQDMPQLRKHLTACHFRPSSSLTCTRCQQSFCGQPDLIAHSQQCPLPVQPQVTVRPRDLEDGFDEDIDRRLRSRKPNERFDDWKTLYSVLFKTNELIPEPNFVPVVEDYEVSHRFNCDFYIIHEHIENLIVRQGFDFFSAVDRRLPAGDIESLKERIESVLKLPSLVPQVLHTPSSFSGEMINQSPSPGGEFVDVTTEGVVLEHESPNPDPVPEASIISRAMLPVNMQVESQTAPGVLDGPERDDLAQFYSDPGAPVINAGGLSMSEHVEFGELEHERGYQFIQQVTANESQGALLQTNPLLDPGHPGPQISHSPAQAQCHLDSASCQADSTQTPNDNIEAIDGLSWLDNSEYFYNGDVFTNNEAFNQFR